VTPSVIPQFSEATAGKWQQSRVCSNWGQGDIQTLQSFSWEDFTKKSVKMKGHWLQFLLLTAR